METKYPTMRRPKRKLCYITDKEKLSNQWERPLTVMDVDKLFDDIDLCWNDVQLQPGLLESSDPEANQGETSPKEDNKNLAASPKLDIDLNHQSEILLPGKTSSPIELDMGLEKYDKDEEITTSPVLFNCDEDMAEEVHEVPTRETPKKKGIGTKKGQENTEVLDPAVSQKSVLGVSGNTRRAGEITSQVARDKTTFLEKFKVDTQSSKKNLKKAQVTAPPPPDPEDDFLILEDEATFWVSIPSKSVSKRRQKQIPADDLEQQEKEKNEQKVASKKRVNAEFLSKDKSNEESDKEKPSDKMQTTEKKSSDKKSTKDNKKTTKKSIEKTVKEASKQILRGLLEKDGTDVGLITNRKQEESSKEPTETQDPNLFTDENIVECRENKKNKKIQLPAESGGSSSEDTQKNERRKRKPPGHRWLCSERFEENPNQQPELKKLKNSKKPSTAVCGPVEAPKQPVGRFSKQKKEKKPKQTKKRQNAEEVESAKSKATGIEQQEIADQNLDQVQSSPLIFTPSCKSGDQIFPKVYNVCSAKMSTPSAAPNNPLCDPETGKRRRKPPGDWWTVSRADDDPERISLKPQQLCPKEPKPCKAKKRSEQRKSAELGVPQNENVTTPRKAAGGALEPPLKFRSPPKSVRRSLKDVFPAAAEPRHNVSSHSAKECSYSDFPAGNTFDKDSTSEEVGESIATRSIPQTQPNLKCQSDTLKALQSGPSSMIALEQYEDNDNMSLKSSRLQPALCVSDLCAPPLRPLTLHPKDKGNLNEWLQALWSTTSDNGSAVAAEHFEWYSYQDRALGFQVDLNNGSICSGKFLLGSHMKKPLWVDHSATTVFNVLTSTVRVNINSTVFRFRPGQSFIAECGQAYSLQNLNSEPAVLFFTRIVAESSD